MTVTSAEDGLDQDGGDEDGDEDGGRATPL